MGPQSPPTHPLGGLLCWELRGEGRRLARGQSLWDTAPSAPRLCPSDAPGSHLPTSSCGLAQSEVGHRAVGAGHVARAGRKQARGSEACPRVSAALSDHVLSGVGGPVLPGAVHVDSSPPAALGVSAPHTTPALGPVISAVLPPTPPTPPSAFSGFGLHSQTLASALLSRLRDPPCLTPTRAFTAPQAPSQGRHAPNHLPELHLSYKEDAGGHRFRGAREEAGVQVSGSGKKPAAAARWQGRGVGMQIKHGASREYSDHLITFQSGFPHVPHQSLQDRGRVLQ